MESIRHTVEESITSIMGGLRHGLDRKIEHDNPDLQIKDMHVDPDSVLLPRYDVAVKSRVTHKDPETDEYGTYYQEKVRYTDGAVRLVTIGTPKQPKSNIPVVSADPWMTGPDGFNKIEIQQLVRSGFHVVWNHHHGRHASLPTNTERLTTMLHFLSSKSVGKSAAQQHALIDHLANTAAFNTDLTNVKGYSRSSMTGEAYLALGARRAVPRLSAWSDFEAHCFATSVNATGLAKLLGKQVPHELRAAYDIYQSTKDKTPINDDGVVTRLKDYAATIDVHPLNLAHEAAWIGLFIGGEAGLFGKAVPLDAKGVRVIYKHDYMSQQADQQAMHADRPGIAILERPGAHLSAAAPENLAEKFERYRKLAAYALEHDDDMSQLTVEDITERDQRLAVST